MRYTSNRLRGLAAALAAGCGGAADTGGGAPQAGEGDEGAAAPDAAPAAAPVTAAPVPVTAAPAPSAAAPATAAPPSTAAAGPVWDSPCDPPPGEAPEPEACMQMWANLDAQAAEDEAQDAARRAAAEPAEPEPGPPADTAPPATTEPPEPAGPAETEDLPPDIPEGQAPAPQASGLVWLGPAGPLRGWAEHLCDEADVTARGYGGCADFLGRYPTLGGCFYAPARLGVGDEYTYTGPAKVFDPPLADGTLTKSQRVDGMIRGFSEPKKLDGTAPGAADMWAWVIPDLEWEEFWVYGMAEGPDETEMDRELAGRSHVRWAVVGGGPWPGGALSAGLLAVPVPADPDGFAASC